MVNSKISTKTRILEGSRDLFFSKGVRYFTMEGVADHVGVSKRTLYKYYSSREDLVNNIIDSLFDRIMQIFRSSMENDNNPVKQMYYVLMGISKLSSKMPMNRLLDIKTQYPRAWERIETFNKDRIVEWYRIFSDGQKKGYFRGDIDMDVMSKIHIRILNSIFTPEFFTENQVTIQEAFQVWVKMLSTGILTFKGKKYDTSL